MIGRVIKGGGRVVADRTDLSSHSPLRDGSPPRPSRIPVEWSGRRAARRAPRLRVYLYAALAVAVLGYLAALAASNTRTVRVDWVFGSSSPALVWLVLFAAVLGAVLALLFAAALRWRSRRRRPGRSRSL